MTLILVKTDQFKYVLPIFQISIVIVTMEPTQKSQ